MQTLMHNNSPMTSIPERLPTQSMEEYLDCLSITQRMSLPIDLEWKEKLKQGGERLREGLSSAPYWAEGETKARELGGQARVEQYWQGLFASQRNLHRPPKKHEEE
jgi:hypothetical protein